jgi:hypothetical protein
LAAPPNGAELFDALIDSMRLALATAIHDVFLLSAIVAAGDVIAALFLPEAPLRRRQHVPLVEEAGQELAATEAGIAAPLNSQAEPRLVGAATSDARELAVAGSRGDPRDG